MNKKHNVNYIKPEDPEFLKVLKKQAGYDNRNHKFDELANDQDDFVDDGESEMPQVVVLKEGDLTAEEAEKERLRIEKLEAETKADLSQRVIFNPRSKLTDNSQNERKRKHNTPSKIKDKKKHNLLSFDCGDDGEESS